MNVKVKLNTRNISYVKDIAKESLVETADALKGDVQAFNTIREVVQDEKTVQDEDRVQIINDLPNEEGENG